MRSVINELWHGNVCPQTDSRNNSPEMKELMEYMARHHDDLLKTMTDEQKVIFEKFDDCCTRAMPKSLYLHTLSNSVCRLQSKH